MSVVVKDCQNGKIILFSKGADEAILPYTYNGKSSFCLCFFIAFLWEGALFIFFSSVKMPWIYRH